MAIGMAPVLGFRGCEGDHWLVSVLVAAKEAAAPPLQWSPDPGLAGSRGPEKTTLLLEHGARKLWRHDFTVARTEAEQAVHYRAGGSRTFRFVVPPRGASPRLVYASCNGFSSLKAMKQVKVKNAMWSHLADRHAARPFHLLLMGGDQVYADSMWEAEGRLGDWAGLRWNKRVAATFTKRMKKEAEQFYFDLYLKRWSQPEPAEMLASIPSLMMWDDHDIFDGWGSYPKEMHECDVYQGVFDVARRHFEAFQLRTEPGTAAPATLANQPAFTYAHRVGDVAILAVDMRSERTLDRVVGERAWAAIKLWMNGRNPDGSASPHLQGCKHLLVMSSIPVVHKDFATLEKFLGSFPGQQSLEDDLKDHWMSTTHRQERLRFIHRMLNFSEKSGCRVTILSGDVHVGAVGTIVSDRDPGVERNARVINQLTSSGIVHPAPPGMALWFLEQTSGDVEQVDRDISARMIAFPGTDKKYIGTRNYLTLEPDPEGTLWANWWVEGEPAAFTKAVHAVT